MNRHFKQWRIHIFMHVSNSTFIFFLQLTKMQAVINIKYDKINMCVITYEYICMYFYIYLHRILKNNYSRILIFLQFFYEHFYLTIVNNSNLQHQSYSCVNISHLKLWRHPIPWNHGLNKLESTLPDDASTQV